MTSPARLAILDDPAEVLPDLIQIGRVDTQPTQAGLGVGYRCGDRLVDLVGNRGRQLSRLVTRVTCARSACVCRRASDASI